MTAAAVALKSNQTIAATPSIRIPATPGTAQLYGPFVNGPNGYCNASSCEFAPSTELRVRYRHPDPAVPDDVDGGFVDGGEGEPGTGADGEP